ncbi:hypothetical protein GCM10023082_21970 [Streptomyces tremellae]|uniref:Uncharacterized protein n=1 Tax=Streptomyces tremellae TaxID=1124239 RepID=A0ABP7ETN3_9ACTN
MAGAEVRASTAGAAEASASGPYIQDVTSVTESSCVDADGAIGVRGSSSRGDMVSSIVLGNMAADTGAH